jgi:signal peptidase II
MWRLILKKYLIDYSFLFSIAGIVLLLDQGTKSLVRANVPIGVVLMPGCWLSRYVRIIHWKNSGAALGMFQNNSNFFAIFPIVIGLFILYYFPRVPRENWMARLAMGFLLGGAMGNLVDRLILGHVTDFISVGALPVGNIADGSIILGTTLIILWIWMQERLKTHSIDAQLGEDSNQQREMNSRTLSKEIKGE